MAAFLDALLTNCEHTGVEKVLVLSPVNTLLNWLDEFEKWIPWADRNYNVRTDVCNSCVLVILYRPLCVIMHKM